MEQNEITCNCSHKTCFSSKLGNYPAILYCRCLEIIFLIKVLKENIVEDYEWDIVNAIKRIVHYSAIHVEVDNERHKRLSKEMS